MARRPAVRKSDLSAAWAAALALGLRLRSTRFHSDGGFSIEFDEKPAVANDDLDNELEAFEARYGDD